MAETAPCMPSRADGSGSIVVATYNIRSGWNGGLESALRAMDGIGADLGILLETKVTDGIYTRNLSGYSVVASNAPSAHQGGIALFWRPNKSYMVEDWQIRGPNVLTFVLVTGSCQFFAVGCYIPPNDLSTLTAIEQAWNKCPRGHVPLLIGDLNVNLRSPRDERDEQIAEVVEDVMGLTDLSRHFLQRSRGSVRGRWTWRMRRGRRWVSSQCDYVLGRATDHGKYRSVRLRTPRHHDSDHRAIITNIRVGSATRMAAYRKWMAKFPLKLPSVAPRTSFALCSRGCASMSWRRPRGHNRATPGILPPRGGSSIEGHCSDSRGSCRSECPVFLVGKSRLVSRGTGGSVLPTWRGILRGSWRVERRRRRGGV